jgi:hypothetical protein
MVMDGYVHWTTTRKQASEVNKKDRGVKWLGRSSKLQNFRQCLITSFFSPSWVLFSYHYDLMNGYQCIHTWVCIFDMSTSFHVCWMLLVHLQYGQQTGRQPCVHAPSKSSDVMGQLSLIINDCWLILPCHTQCMTCKEAALCTIRRRKKVVIAWCVVKVVSSLKQLNQLVMHVCIWHHYSFDIRVP